MNVILQIAGQDAPPTGGGECDTTDSGTGTKTEN